ncbi:MAG: DUF1795 domain-containing protein [bacterium]|nr:DUF1795 domain-containing protein [bacterium]
MTVKDNGFRFDLPAGWEDQTVYYFRGPRIDERDHQLMLVIDRNLQQTEIGEFARLRTQPIVETLQGVEILKDEETTIAGCYPSYDFVYRWIPVNGLKLFRRHIFVLRENQGYGFEIEFSKMSYKMLGRQVKTVVEKLLPGTYEVRTD